MLSIFFDSNGSFQLTAVTAVIVGGFSLFTNYRTLKQQKELNTENFKGNVVANARIEWIQEVRKRSVDFIAACYELIEVLNSNMEDFTDMQSLKGKVEKNSTLLILYFGPDKDQNNDFIVFLITLLSDKLINKENCYDKKHILSLSKEIEVFRNFLRIYYKAEWKRANGEIKDDEVKKYLENQQEYLTIMRIYKDSFEMHKEWVESFYTQVENELKI